ncbi:DUF3967 domain-containing protein [Oceanobacillus sp. J11TS1]|uniref:DUF3967 domain-containing protein n=1 Tax=Oceanobacillus sp. J11TS1 TaxID=2807191 RepID=UPI001B0FEBCF|nr:DUF3967 domain-containing protein [Oceanobacillus sp. J11TS1]GIO25348.1 hypothetical protein J11TS1_39290 [Oceanobacillus sp. J11TS1]
MEKEWFTVAEMEKETNIPHQTIRRYIKVHGHHLHLKKQHKSFFINYSSIDVILKIRKMYSDGKTSESVDEILANSNIPMTIDLEKDNEQVSIHVPNMLQELNNNIVAMNHKMVKQEEFNAELLEQVRKQQKYIDERLSKRDEALIKAMNEVMDTKRQLAATEQNKKKWWQFWLK